MNSLENNNTPSKTTWYATGFIVAAVLMWMYGFQGYAGGYGKVVGGEVDFGYRGTLWQNVRAGYQLDDGEWKFGYFVPFAVAGLFWIRRKELLATPVRPALGIGAFLLFLGFFFYFGGYKANQKYIGFASGQILVAGIIFWFLGWEWFKKTFWLWALLGMFWPWVILIERIASPLQHVMVFLTDKALSVTGIGSVKTGTAVMTDTPDPVTGELIKLNVAAACSGLRSLFALVMIGLVFAFMRVREEWKRWVLMACVPLVAVAGNFVRMMMLYWGSRWWGTEFAIGEGNETNASSYHMVAGLVVFAVAVVLMSLIVEVMNRGMGYFKRAKVARRTVNAPVVNSES